ncbi:MAG: SH3 domain-containing protein [Selenomonadaceae bacterium]|nr:SH3 domain-containing protein [Selenomonadaceae bacterium]
MRKILGAIFLSAALIFVGNSSSEAYVKPVVNVQGGQAQVVNCEEWITLRGEPSVEGESLAQIPLGAYVIRYQNVPGTDFCVVKYNGILGYALTYYLRSTGVES